MFMNAVKTVVTALIFCSIVTCLAQFKSFSEIGRVGAKITALFVFRMFLAAVLGAVIFLVFQPGGGTNLAETSETAVNLASYHQGNFIADIVPSNLLRPFLEMSMMQLICLSFLFGIVFSLAGESAKLLLDVLEAGNRLFMAIVKLNPFVMLSKYYPAALIAISIPGITGAALVCISVVMSQLGIPAKALGLIMGVDALQNFLTPPTNSMSAIASTISVCAREGILDRDIFYAESEAQK